jgi:hypothetical protein
MVYPNEAILEEECQKRLSAHGVKLKLDLIIHIPIETGLSTSVRDNNFVLFV